MVVVVVVVGGGGGGGGKHPKHGDTEQRAARRHNKHSRISIQFPQQL